MIKAAIFDLDGTLLNRDASLASFVADQYERLTEHLKHIPQDRFSQRFIELDAKGYVWKDKVYQQLIDEFEIKGISWQTLLEDYLNNFKNHCVPFPHLSAMLENLTAKSIQLAMITNGKGQFQLDNILALQIEGYFEHILISEWEKMAKPEPAIFQKMLGKLGIFADEAVYIGDHPKNDIQAARAVGMKTIWKKDLQWKSSDADKEITDLNEIVEWIEYSN